MTPSDGLWILGLFFLQMLHIGISQFLTSWCVIDQASKLRKDIRELEAEVRKLKGKS